MELLFRAPLFTFDIKNPIEIEKHWPEILEAIRLSSLVLFEKIQLKQPVELSPREKETVYRYLLRGKYRPTPFGKWAGVGIAKWVSTEEQTKAPTALTTSLIRSEVCLEQSGEYWLNSSLESWGDGWKFWNYDFEKEQWRYSKSADSPLIQELRNLSFGDQPIKKERFFHSLNGLLHSEKELIWQHLIDKQLLIAQNFSREIDHQEKEDRFIEQKLILKEQYKHKLDDFFNEIGNVATYQENDYLQILTERFIEEFDDRFVPLKMLWKLVPYLKTKQGLNNFNLTETLSIDKMTTSTLDLRKLQFNPLNRTKVRHTQALFRVLENEQILIDNLVFNRPFVYGGRFTHKPELFDYFNRKSGLEDDFIYASVKLVESHKATRVSSHHSVTSIRLNCFSGSSAPNELDVTDTYLGIQEGKLILMAPKLGKEVIPLFEHPLNPNFITHPICRIIWEVAHQDFLKPIYYSSSQFTNSEYLPQLQWGDIILQPRQWKMNRDSTFRNVDHLIQQINDLGVPERILVGFQDQELALDLSYKQDQEILYTEINKKKVVHIQEWLWKNQSYRVGKSEFYPQFLWGSVNRSLFKETLLKTVFNYISDIENTSWFCVNIRLSPNFQATIINHQMRLFFDGLDQESIKPYYYLYYGQKTEEIRIRCKVADQKQKDKVVTILHGSIRNISEIDHLKITPYFPEYIKYSKSDITVSEELFYQETKMIFQLNPKTKNEKIMLAVGIGSLYLMQDPDKEFWIEYFKEEIQAGSTHLSPKPYIKHFEQSTSKEWRMYFIAIVKRHQWAINSERKGMFIRNHIHMLINRIFWEEGLAVESEVISLLSSILREKKYCH